VQITRHRRVLTVASIAASAVALLAVVSIAGAATRDGHVDVAGPSTPDDTTIVSTTSVPILFPTSTTNPPPRNTTVPVVTPTTVANCAGSPEVNDSPADSTFTLLENGDIEMFHQFSWDHFHSIIEYFILDDGTTGSDSFTKTYSPAEFGPHWYVNWHKSAYEPGSPGSCKQRHNFLVDPSVITPTTTSTTTTTVPGDTVPVETTIPESTTTIGG
jgi:hypothetical protein